MRALLLVVGLHLVVFGGQQALLHQKQQVEHSAGAAVAVGEGVDGFELVVAHGHADQWVRVAFLTQVAFPVGQQLEQRRFALRRG
jgi:hypothetical protein